MHLIVIGFNELFFFILNNWGILIPIPFVFFLYTLWKFKGRETNWNEPIIVKYNSPDKLTPGEIGYLLEGYYSERFVAADLINLAIKGYIRIFEFKDEITNKYSLVTYFCHVIVISVVTTFYFFLRPNLGVIFGVLLLSIATFIAVRKFVNKKGTKYQLENIKDWRGDGRLTVHERRLLTGVFGSTPFSKVPLFRNGALGINIEMAANNIRENLKLKKYFKASVQHKKQSYVIFGVIFSLLLIGAALTFKRWDFIFSAFVIFLTFLRAGSFMAKKTSSGVDIYKQIRGYAKYVSVAEIQRSKFYHKEGILEKHLPYAIVFDNVGKLADKIDKINETQPDWYCSDLNISELSLKKQFSGFSKGFISVLKSVIISSNNSRD